MSGPTGALEPYVPRVSAEWDLEAPGSSWRQIDGSLVFVDISGFTNLSERLSRKGRIGAEELTSVLNRVFGRMLDVVFQRGGSLLKFGGDALLLLFATDDHVMQACAATVEMRTALRDAAKEPTSVGLIRLKMSSGIHTGKVDLFLVGDSHRELIVTGPTASTTTEVEGTADAGEIVVSPETKARLPKDFIGDRKDDGWLLRKRKINHRPCGPGVRRSAVSEQYSTRVPKALRDYLAAGITEPEHRIATVGFLKFKGVDALLAQEGPERVGQELERLTKVVQEAADAERVTFLASDIDADGGKIIFAAGVPVSQHDDEGRMLRVARQVLDADLGLPVMIGLNRGHVFAGDVGSVSRRTYTVMGDTVNLAARLMAAARPGSLYVSPSVLDLSSTLFRTVALEPFIVKGKEQPVQAYEVFEETGVRDSGASRELPFAGRDAELQTIVGIVTTCAKEGRGGMMTITGDTGTGKSRLIAEVLERCPGLDTLMVQAEPNGTDNPYWAFRDPLRRALGISRGTQAEMIDALIKAIGEIAPRIRSMTPLLGDVVQIEVPDTEDTAAIDPQFRPDRTADALIDLLSALYSGPFAILAEDGHWMDDASIQLLRRIGAAADSRPWTVIFTARREENDFEPIGTEIALRPLDEEAVRSIAIEATAAAPLRPHELESVVERAGGNPLFLSEILNVIHDTGSAENLPETLDAVVSSEIDTLPPLTRQLLRYSSVLGRSFRRVVLDEFLAPEPVQMDEATQKELERFIDADGDTRLRFRHAVVHDAAYQGLSFRRRRELHARAGAVIERLAGDDPDSVAEFLAIHYSQAAEWTGAFEFSLKAGAKADAMYANMQAAVFYERALAAARHLETNTPSETAALQEARGDALERAGRFEDSLAEYAAALRFTPDVTRKADLMFKRARLKAFSGSYPAGLAELTRAIRLLEDERDRSALAAKARNHSFRSVIRMMQGRSDDALELAETAHVEAADAGEKEALARSYMVLDAACLTLGRPTDDDYLPRALAIYEETGDLLGAALVYNNMGERAWLDGRLDDAIVLYTRADETSRRAGNDPDAANARTNVGEVLIAQGRLDEAKAILDDSARVMRAHDSHQAVFADIQLARVALESGRVAESISDLRHAVEEADSMGQTEWALIAAVYLASAQRAQGEPAMALALLNEAEANVDQGGDLYGPLLAKVRAETLRDLGDRSGALDSALKGRNLASGLGLNREHSELDQLVIELEMTAARV